MIAYVAVVSSDPAAAGRVLEQYFGLACTDVATAAGPVPVYPIGSSALALVAPGHALVDGEASPGVHHIALGVENVDVTAARFAAVGIDVAGPTAGLGGRPVRHLGQAGTAGVRLALTEGLEWEPPPAGAVSRIDHIGVASTDVRQDEDIFCSKLGFAVESRQTDIEVSMAVESFTSDKYGVVYHARAPEPVGGLRVTFVTVGDCELEFLANFDPRQGGGVEHGRAGTTRQDQGAIARFVATRGRGLHHIALRTVDIDLLLAKMSSAGLPMIDVKGRPGSRRAQIGFLHPRALGGVLLHLVQRPG